MSQVLGAAGCRAGQRPDRRSYRPRRPWYLQALQSRPREHVTMTLGGSVSPWDPTRLTNGCVHVPCALWQTSHCNRHTRDFRSGPLQSTSVCVILLRPSRAPNCPNRVGRRVLEKLYRNVGTLKSPEAHTSMGCTQLWNSTGSPGLVESPVAHPLTGPGALVSGHRECQALLPVPACALDLSSMSPGRPIRLPADGAGDPGRVSS